MKNIEDIKIVGMDEKRPPLIRKEPYIDLFFKLSHEAPADWCDDFNSIAKKLTPPAKINLKTPLFVETYVRDMEHIPNQLALIKKKIINCSKQYIERYRLMALADASDNNSVQSEGGKQGKLNKIIDSLNFND